MLNNTDEYKTLIEKSRLIRKTIAKMYYRAGWGHFAPALSCTDILVAIIWGKDRDASNIFQMGRDKLVMSKGHGCAALYAAYAELGLLSNSELNTFYQNDSRLIGLASCLVPEIDIPTGSLGHGICFATGIAYAHKIDDTEGYTFVILGDGEAQEGSVWEAAEFAAAHCLNNLIVILDRNGLQASDWVNDILPCDSQKDKWLSFGWNVQEANGHDYDALISSILQAKISDNKPSIIIANTVKGKGVTIAENNPEWHSRAPKNGEWDIVCADLNISHEELEII